MRAWKVFSIASAMIGSGLLLPAPADAESIVLGGYTQNFDSLGTSGSFTFSLGTWAINETGTLADGKYTAGTGSSATGDVYSFGISSAATDRALGTLRSGSLLPIIGGSFTNDTGSTIGSLLVEYVGEQWRLGATGGRKDQLDFQYSLDATSLTTGTWIDVNALDFATPNTATFGPLNGNLSLNRTSLSSSITDLTIADGATFWIRWLDADPTGSDDGLAIDDFKITPTVLPAAVPTPTAIGGGLALMSCMALGRWRFLCNA